MKRGSHLVVLVVLCLALIIGAACGGGGGEEEESGVKELKIGIGEPLTGALGAVVGLPCKVGFELAADKIGVFTVGDEQYRWKTIILNNTGDATGGVATATKFTLEHGVHFIHQTGGAPALASQPICEGRDVILDCGCTTMQAFGPDHPTTFQSGPFSLAMDAPFYDWVSKAHPEVERITVVQSNAPLLIAFAESFESDMHEYFGLERDLIIYDATTVEFYHVANRVMSTNPELVMGPIAMFEIMSDMGYEGIYVCGGGYFEYQLENIGWDRCKGLITYHPTYLGDTWPETSAFAAEFERRSGAELGITGFWAGQVLYTITGALQLAGTVDDTEKIREAIASRTYFDSLVGPVYYGGEGIVGVNHLVMWPISILEVVGPYEYEQLAYYTPEECEAITVEAWQATK